MRGGYASQGRRREPLRKAAHQNRGEEHQKMGKNANWQTIKDDLIRIKKSLEKKKKIDVNFA